LAIVAGLVLAIAPHFALAQGPAGRKITGEVYWPSRATTHRVQSARNYAYEFQTYVAKAPQPEPSVVKDIKTELGRYLDEGQKHLATMKKDLEGDKEAVAAVENIEKELATAIEHNKAMIACCEDQKFDKIKTMACCTDLVKQLDKVHADHVALMKKLAAKYAATPAKP
jgi:flagellar motility protein MotE (MotC chaperone)